MTPLPNMMDQNDTNAAGVSRAGSPEDEPPQPSGGDAPSAQLAIVDTTKRLDRAQLGWLERFGMLAISAAVVDRVGTHQVELSIVDDDTMSELHQSHSGIAGTTDVLTFDMRDDVTAGPLEVEIVACIDVATREARETGIPVERELLLYLLHGVLHCIGYDDHGEEAFRAMHEREDAILESIGVGAVFRDGGAA